MTAAMTEQEAITAIMKARIRAVAERCSYPAATIDISFNTGECDEPVEVFVRMVQVGSRRMKFCKAVGRGQTIDGAAADAVEAVDNLRTDGWEVEPS